MDDKRLMDQGWAEMHTLLDREMPLKDRRRRLIAWLFTGISIVALIMVGVMAMWSSDTVEGDHLTTVNDKGIADVTTQEDRSAEGQRSSSRPADKAYEAAPQQELVSVEVELGRDQAVNTERTNLEQTAMSRDDKRSGIRNNSSDSGTSRSYAADLPSTLFVDTNDKSEARKGITEVPTLAKETTITVIPVTVGQSFSVDGDEAQTKLDIKQIQILQPSLLAVGQQTPNLDHIAYTAVTKPNDRAEVGPYVFAQGIFSSSSRLLALGAGVKISKESNGFFAGLGLLNTRYQDVVGTIDIGEELDTGGVNVSSVVTPSLDPNNLWGYNVELGYDRSLSSRFKIGLRADFMSFWHELAASTEATINRVGSTYLYDAVQRQAAISPTITYSPLPQLSLQLGLRQPIYEQRFMAGEELEATAFPTRPVAVPRSITLDIPRSLALTVRYSF